MPPLPPKPRPSIPSAPAKTRSYTTDPAYWPWTRARGYNTTSTRSLPSRTDQSRHGNIRKSVAVPALLLSLSRTASSLDDPAPRAVPLTTKQQSAGYPTTPRHLLLWRFELLLALAPNHDGARFSNTLRRPAAAPHPPSKHYKPEHSTRQLISSCHSKRAIKQHLLRTSGDWSASL